jgi:hypothetical protein
MRRALRALGFAGAAAVLVLAAVAVGVSLAHAGYDAQSNRAPAARIVLAGIALVLAAGGLRTAGAARSGPASRGLLAIGLESLAVVFVLAWLIVTLSSGRL